MENGKESVDDNNNGDSYKIVIYVLELEGGYYYVGKTRKFDKRFRQHVNGKGAEWTKLYKPKKVIKTFTFDVHNEEQEYEKENEATLAMMKLLGWRKVRGGFFTTVDEYATLKSLNNKGLFLDETPKDVHIKAYEVTIFVLKLECEKYFVGYSRNFDKAIKNHKKGKASSWTKKYPVIEVLETQSMRCNREHQIISVADEIVHRYFDKYGARNVRGGSYVIYDDDSHLESVNLKNPSYTYY